jgi:hypothetical protein
MDIRKDATCLGLLKEDILPDTMDLEERKRARKKKPIIVGKSRGSTLRDCLCPNQRKLFYQVTLDTVGPLLETKSRNKYILVVVHHYSKWYEAKVVANHGAKTATKFLEDDVICRYGIPKFVLINNGGEWATKFDVMCKDYSIQHQHTTPQWPQCNGMAKRLIKTIKHGITIFFATPKNIDCWDEQLSKVMFGYRCGI